MKRALIKNSVSGIIQLLLTSVLLLLAIPVFLRFLGEEQYGVFSLIMVIGNLNTFANFGLNSSLVKFLSEQGHTDVSDHDIWVNIIVSSLISCLVVLVGLFLHRPILLNVLNIQSHMYADARVLFYSALVANGLLFIGQPFSAILDAQHKIYLSNLCQLVYSVLYWGLILAFLVSGMGLSSIGAAILIASAGWLLLVIVLSLQSWGVPRIAGLKQTFVTSMRKQLVLGFQIYNAGLISLLYEPLTKVLLSHFLGLREVGFYDIALRIRGQIIGLMSRAFYPLYPLIAQINDPARLRFLIRDIEEKIFYLMVPLTALTVFAIPPFVNLWLRGDHPAISTTAVFLIGSYLLGSVTVLPNYQFLMLKGKASKTIILQASNVVFNLIGFLVFFPVYGYYAVIFGGVAAITSSFVLSIYYQKLYLDSYIFGSPSVVIKLGIVFAIDLILGYIVNSITDLAILRIVLASVFIGVATLVLYRLLQFFAPEDVERYFGSQRVLSQWTVRLLCR